MSSRLPTFYVNFDKIFMHMDYGRGMKIWLMPIGLPNVVILLFNTRPRDTGIDQNGFWKYRLL